MPLVVGDSFKSYKDLEDRIHDLQNKESLSLWRRDSRTIEKAKAKGLKRHINAELVYYFCAVCLLSWRPKVQDKVGRSTSQPQVQLFGLRQVCRILAWRFRSLGIGEPSELLTVP